MSQKGKHGHGGHGKGHAHAKQPDKPIGMVRQRSMLAERLTLLVVAFLLIGGGIALYYIMFG